MEASFEGSLAKVEIPDILTFVNMGRRTGLLVMERGGQEIGIHFKDGELVYAGSNREDLRMSTMLVRTGKVSAQDVDRIVREHHSPGDRIGQAFVKAGVITQDELTAFVKVQISEVIFETFEWREGRFRFEDGIIPPADAITLELNLQNLIMEGVRRLDERGRASELFPNLNMVVELAGNPDRVKQRLTLMPEEWRILFLVNGRRTLAELCRLAGNPDESATLLLIHRLQSANLLTLLLASETPPPEPAVPDAVAEGTFLGVGPVEAPVPVEFGGDVAPPKAERDATGIVSPKAVQYFGSTANLTLGLLVLARKGSEAAFPLTRDSYTLGRHRNNDVSISDSAVSGFHARIDRAPDGFVIVDLKSRNGTFVNSKRVETWPLTDGDEIRVGASRLRYKVGYSS